AGLCRLSETLPNVSPSIRASQATCRSTSRPPRLSSPKAWRSGEVVDPRNRGGENVPHRTQPPQALRDFSELVDDEQAVEEMLSYFPARDVEEPVTKDILRAELQTEIGSLRAEMLRSAKTTQTWIITTGLSLAGLF